MKYRNNTDKKYIEIQKKYIEIQNFLHLFNGKVMYQGILDNLHCNISIHIYDSKISVIASNYSFIHRSSEPPNKVRGTKNIIEKNRGGYIWETQKKSRKLLKYRSKNRKLLKYRRKNTRKLLKYRRKKNQKTFEIQKKKPRKKTQKKILKNTDG